MTMNCPEDSIASMDIDALVQRSELPVLVDCYTPGCGPCAALSPLLDQLAIELADQLSIEKVDISVSPDVAVKFSIRSVPTLLLFKGGALVATRTGTANRSQLLTWLSAQDAI
jgi:thioredoxin 1